MTSVNLGLEFKIIAFTSILILVIGAGLFGTVIYEEEVTANKVKVQESLILIRSTANLADDYLYKMDIRELRFIVSNILKGGGVDLIWILDTEGRLITDGSNKPALRNQKPSYPFFDKLITTRKELHVVDEAYHWTGAPVFSGDNSLLGYVAIGLSAQRHDQRLWSSLKNQSTILAPALLLGMLVAFSFARRITRPLNTVTRAVEKMGTGNWDIVIEVNSKDEVGKLASTFNLMARNLSESAVLRHDLEDIVEEKTAALLEHQKNLEKLVAVRTEDLELELVERKRVEQELLLAKEDAEKANKAKSEFLSSMSHELRTPMNAIMGFAQLLKINTKGALSEGQATWVGHILTGSNHLMALIDQVLDLEKIETGKMRLSMEEVHPHKVGLECLTLLDTQLQEKGLSVNNELNSAQVIWGDYLRFKQILLNLLSNAVKYNREAGNITLSSEDRSNKRVRIIVSDTGPGISLDMQDQLFDPFNRLGNEGGSIAGTGIGLTITRKLIEAMGGEIGYESELGTGSSFWVELPACESSAQEIRFTD